MSAYGGRDESTVSFLPSDGAFSHALVEQHFRPPSPFTERVEAALTVLVGAVSRLPLDSWAEDHRPDSVDGCTLCGWDDISKCVYTAAYDTQQALEVACAALAAESEEKGER